MPAGPRRRNPRVLPGFTLALGCTLVYLAVVVLLPLAALGLKAAGMPFSDFLGAIASPRAWATYRLTLGTALIATLFNAAFGLLLAWVLVRYDFPGRRLLDAVVDLPFALPTAVAGIALTALFAKNGWFGAPLDRLGIAVAYTPLGIMIAMAFTSLPFVVRTVQPVLEDLDDEIEEAAHSLGAGELAIFLRVILPGIFPAFLAGCSLAFARCLGEYGAVIFIAGNRPMQTEITALLTFIRLEEYDYPGAAALSVAILATAFLLLLVTNIIQARALRYVEQRR
ncbi:MAG: sulfate ABC transporter permease subunit CysT [Dongiaceae bacterium]